MFHLQIARKRGKRTWRAEGSHAVIIIIFKYPTVVPSALYPSRSQQKVFSVPCALLPLTPPWPHSCLFHLVYPPVCAAELPGCGRVSCAASSWLSPARSSSPGAATRTPSLHSVGFYVESGCEDDFRTVTGSVWGIRRCCSIAVPPCKRSVGCL